MSFWLGAPDGMEGVLIKNLPGFRDWLAEQIAWYASESVEDSRGLNEIRLVSEALSSIPIAELLEVRSKTSAKPVDGVVELFFDFSELEPQRSILPGAGENTYLYVRHWEEAANYVGAKAGPIAKRLWRFLLRGRGVGKNRERFPYVSPDDVTRISFWTSAECKVFLEAIETGIPANLRTWSRTKLSPDEDAVRTSVATTLPALRFAGERDAGLVLVVA